MVGCVWVIIFLVWCDLNWLVLCLSSVCGSFLSVMVWGLLL